MKLKSSEIAVARRKLEEISNLEDFVLLLNEVNSWIYEEEAIVITQEDVMYYANSISDDKKYHVFNIPKKSGSLRTIHAPVRKLKNLQFLISLILQSSFEPHRRAHGFVWNRNVKSNASHHIGSNYVYNIDLEDFFGTIHRTRVEAVLGTHPFHLGGKGKVQSECHPWQEFLKKNERTFAKYGAIKRFTEEKFEQVFRQMEWLAGVHFTTISLARGEKSGHLYVLLGDSEYIIEDTKIQAFYTLDQTGLFTRRKAIATIIAKLTTGLKMMFNDGESRKTYVLPQGSPCSPVLTNIVCRQLDNSIEYLSKKHNVKYSRYADDITFSSMHNVYKAGHEFISELYQIIERHGFKVNMAKVRLQKKQWRQEVTGLLVNDKVNLQKRRWKEIRKWLYYIERYGYRRANEIFNKGTVSLIHYLNGHIAYASMIYGPETDRIKLLKERLEKCGVNIEKSTIVEDEIVMAILQSGIHNGLDQYGKKTKRSRKGEVS